MLEIRGHARGGQGMVTAFELLAKLFSHLGDYQVQAFPAFGVERTGAPIQAFLRIGPHEILNRSNIYRPHLVVVFDDSLLEQVSVLDGLQGDGAVLVNTEGDTARLAGRCARLYTVPATRISRELELGTRSLPIVNAAMIGAVARLLGVDPTVAGAIVRENVPAKPGANAEAVRRAYEAVSGPALPDEGLRRALDRSEVEENAPPAPAAGQGEPAGFEAPFWSEPLSKSKTGNWRHLTPRYVDRTPPCTANCPAGTDVRGFVRLASERKYDEAYELLYRGNPFPSVCGRVCPHFCEQQCNRLAYDEGLNIGAIERFLGDRRLERPAHVAPLRYREEIAVIGSGPAGLTAALRLRERGYPVTVFEALPYAGGMMRTGIPAFRLPDDVLDREIGHIQDRGVSIVLNMKASVEEVADLYSAVVVATGAHRGRKLGLANEQLVTEGLTFLRSFKLYGDAGGVDRGEQVAIIGGGNTAVDVARTALRLGAVPTIYYRRTRQEMPAIPQEVEEALAEGVRLAFLIAPTAVEQAPGGRLRLTLVDMELGDPDASGRRRPVPRPGSEHQLVVDHLIAAVGQEPDDYVFDGYPVAIRQGRVQTAGNHTAVFCAGDMAWGGTVAEAIGSGNKVAEEVHACLRDLPYHPDESMPEVVLPRDINFAYFLPAVREEAPAYKPRDLYRDFSEVNRGLEAWEISAETARCLHCGECFNCGNCFNFCPDAAIHVDEGGRLRIDYDYCKGCGICVQECPCSAIQFELTEETTS